MVRIAHVHEERECAYGRLSHPVRVGSACMMLVRPYQHGNDSLERCYMKPASTCDGRSLVASGRSPWVSARPLRVTAAPHCKGQARDRMMRPHKKRGCPGLSSSGDLGSSFVPGHCIQIQAGDDILQGDPQRTQLPESQAAGRCRENVKCPETTMP